MDHKGLTNRVDKWLRAAIEHDRANMKEYGSMTTLDRIARLRAMKARLKIVARAHERAEDPPAAPKPYKTIPPHPLSRLESLARSLKSFFNRGNR